MASSAVSAEEAALRDNVGGRNVPAEALSCRRAGAPPALGPKLRQGHSSTPAAVSTQPRSQVGSSQRWAGGTLAETPKTIPCPGSPAAAAPASSLSTSPTPSDSDEPSARTRGHQVRGLRRQVEFQEPPRLPRSRHHAGSVGGRFFFKSRGGGRCFRLYLSSKEKTGCVTLPRLQGGLFSGRIHLLQGVLQRSSESKRKFVSLMGASS